MNLCSSPIFRLLYGHAIIALLGATAIYIGGCQNCPPGNDGYFCAQIASQGVPDNGAAAGTAPSDDSPDFENSPQCPTIEYSLTCGTQSYEGSGSVIEGTEGDDTLVLTANGTITLNGEEYGDGCLAFDYIIDMKAGNDVVTVENGEGRRFVSDLVIMGEGNDTWTGGSFVLGCIDLGPGDDVLADVSMSNSEAFGQAGADTFRNVSISQGEAYGGAGGDILDNFSMSQSELYLDAGNDSGTMGRVSQSEIYGGTENDSLVFLGRMSQSEFYGEAGDDNHRFTDMSQSRFYGDIGNDTFLPIEGPAPTEISQSYIYGGPGNDALSLGKPVAGSRAVQSDLFGETGVDTLYNVSYEIQCSVNPGGDPGDNVIQQ